MLRWPVSAERFEFHSILFTRNFVLQRRSLEPKARARRTRSFSTAGEGGWYILLINLRNLAGSPFAARVSSRRGTLRSGVWAAVFLGAFRKGAATLSTRGWWWGGFWGRERSCVHIRARMNSHPRLSNF